MRFLQHMVKHLRIAAYLAWLQALQMRSHVSLALRSHGIWTDAQELLLCALLTGCQVRRLLEVQSLPSFRTTSAELSSAVAGVTRV